MSSRANQRRACKSAISVCLWLRVAGEASFLTQTKRPLSPAFAVGTYAIAPLAQTPTRPAPSVQPPSLSRVLPPFSPKPLPMDDVGTATYVDRGQSELPSNVTTLPRTNTRKRSRTDSPSPCKPAKSPVAQSPASTTHRLTRNPVPRHSTHLSSPGLSPSSNFENHRRTAKPPS